MPRARPLPSSLGDSFTFAEGTAAGATPKQLRRAEFAAPFRAARMRPSPDEDEKADQDEDPFRDPLVDIVRSLSTAYALVMPPDAHLSHSTAAAHHGLPLPRHAFALHEDPLLAISDRVFVEAAVHGPGRAPRGGRIRGHETVAAQDPVMRVAGIPMSTPAATWGSLAARLSIEELVSVGDAAVRVPRIPGPFGRVLRAPLATFEDLDAVIRAGRRVGIGRLREARTLIRVGSASPKETELRLVLTRGTGLPAPVLDHDVCDDRGRFLGCSEIAYPAFRTAVEYEGDYHRTDRRRWQSDIEKYQAYAAAGWRVVQVTAHHLRVPRRTVQRVREVLLQAGWRPGPR